MRRRMCSGSGLMLLLSLAVLSACAGGDATGPADTSATLTSATISPSGGSLASSDGQLRVLIPSGSYSTAVELSIETLAATQGADSLAPKQYRISASDQYPSQPATLVWKVSSLATTEAALYGHGFTWIRKAGAHKLRALANQRLKLNAVLDEVELEARVDTLNLLVQRVIDDGLQASLGPVPASGVVGQQFAVKASVRQTATAKISATISYTDRLAETPQPGPLELQSPSPVELATTNAQSGTEFTKAAASYQWVRALSGRFRAELSFSSLSVDSARMDGGWTMEFLVPVFARQAQAADSVFTVATTQPEGLVVFPAGWGPFSRTAVAVCGSNGVPIIDPLDGHIVSDHFLGFGEILGGVALSSERAPGSAAPRDAKAVAPARGLFLFGAGGASFTPYDSSQGAFASAITVEEGTDVSDATPYGGDAASGGICYAMHGLNEVRFLEYDPQLGEYRVSATRIAGSELPQAPGPIRSACRREWGGDVLVLCGGEPGALYLWRAGTQDALKIAAVGNDPEQLRVLDEVAVVSNLGKESLTSFHWPRDGVPEWAAEISHGSGSRGIDLRVQDAQLMLISSSFYDDSYQLTILAADATELSARTSLLPEAAPGPSAAVFLDDSTAMVACFTSDKVVRVSW